MFQYPPLIYWLLQFRQDIVVMASKVHVLRGQVKSLLEFICLLWLLIIFPVKTDKMLSLAYWKAETLLLPTKVHLVKAMVFPVVMYGRECWTVKKAERWRIDAFELWCWGRLLRVPWTARRSKPSILKEISPEYSLEGLMLKLKLQYFGHLMWRADSLEKTLILGKI